MMEWLTVPTNIRDQLDFDLSVSQLDPLASDKFFQEEFIKAIEGQDIRYLNEASSRLCQTNLHKLSVLEGAAALRDLGMLASALTKLTGGEAPIPKHLEESLVKLGTKIYEVPRDTVFSYGPRNPHGKRMRRFTNSNEEHIFIDSFRKGMKENAECILSLDKAWHISIHDTSFSREILKAKQHFEHMVEAIITVKKNVPPSVFTFQLRPFFDPYSISGRSLLAPGGAQMPVIIIDNILWGSDSIEPLYTKYLTENISYSPKSYKDFLSTHSGRNGLIGKVQKQYLQRPENTISINSIASLIEFMNSLLQFRHVHLKVALDNFKLRGGMDVGSGGYTPTILEFLLKETRDKRLLLINSIKT